MRSPCRYTPLVVSPSNHEPCWWARPSTSSGRAVYRTVELTRLGSTQHPAPGTQHPFRSTQDVTVDKSAKPGSTVTVAGTVNYQACDDRVCYAPESAPVTWTVIVK